jgi:membrane protease YdiL (CAAX protease family)
MSDSVQAASAPTSPWTNSKAIIIGELVLVGLIFTADYYHWHHLIVLSKTPYLFLLAWVTLRLRSQTWRSVGWAIYRSWGRTFALGVLLGIGNELLELFVTQPLLVRLFHRWPDLSDLRPLVGNRNLLVLALLLTWTLAAVGEELVYRGYLMNRVADLFGRTRTAWTLSVILTSILFGFGHYDQGAIGQIENVIGGCFLAVFYLACGRKLAVPIMAHGVQDTIDVLLIFLGKYPGGL